MIKLKENLDRFKSVIKIISSINTETDITFNEKGMFVRVVDLSSVCLSRIEVSKDMFDEYDITKEITYTLNVELLAKIIKKVGKKELILDIKDDGLYVRDSEGWFKINYYVGSKDERPIPTNQSQSKWNVESSKLFSTVGELAELSEISGFTAGEDLRLKLKANLLEGERVISRESLNKVDTLVYYDNKFLLKAEEVKNVFDFVNVDIEVGKPLFLHNKDELIDFVFILAPRMEDNI